MSTSAVLGVIALGLVNWIVTVIVTQNKVCEDVREFVEHFGTWLEPKSKRLGGKVKYFASCPMCVGVWLGFAEAAAFGGPLHPHPSWASWIANGLLYKAIGHLVLQLSAVLHNVSEMTKQPAPVSAPAQIAPCPLLEADPDRELDALTAR